MNPAPNTVGLLNIGNPAGNLDQPIALTPQSYGRREDRAANILAGITGKDSPLMQQAKTAGLQQANQRGMLNSSMAIGTAQDSAYRAALPLAQQQSQQAATENLAGMELGSRERTVAAQMQEERRRLAADLSSREGMQLSDQVFRGTQAGMDRSLQELIQKRAITSQEGMQLRDIASREGMAAADRALQQMLQQRQFDFAGTQAGLDRSLQTALQASQITAQEQAQIRDIVSREGLAAADRALSELLQGREIVSREGMQERQFEFTGTQAAFDRSLQTALQANQISAQEQAQIRDIESRFGLQANDAASLLERLGLEIASREGMQADEIEFRRQAMMEEIGARFGLQENDIAATMERMERDIASRAATQEREIEYQTSERALDRGLQEQLASWNLSSSDRNAAAQMLSNMETLYEERYRTIMANTDLDAATRTEQLTSAMNLRDAQIDFIQQLYNVQLSWTMADGKRSSTPSETSSRFGERIGGWHPDSKTYPAENLTRPEKIICGYFHAIGWLPRDIYIGDLRYGATLDRGVIADYLAWATPVVRYLEAKNRPVLKRVLWMVAKPWAYECAHRAGVYPTSTLIGRWFVRNPRLINALFAPMVRAFGLVADPA